MNDAVHGQRADRWRRLSNVIAAAAIALAVVGYFIGITDGVPRPTRAGFPVDHHSPVVEAQENAIPSLHYREIPEKYVRFTQQWRLQPQPLSRPELPPYGTELHPDPQAKLASLRRRSQTRAFNGAPPVIPHAIENTTDAACYACHSQGMQLEGLRASIMSHAFLPNCTQCHVPPPPEFVSPEDYSPPDNAFVGMQAPVAGPRAYPGAPPTIPHATSMRENCLACHGPNMGWPGMETTHPWRMNCTQCHAPSAVLDQMPDTSPIRRALYDSVFDVSR
ncbi:MAG: hypothetical protein KatS3mg111_3599 [Pirellulaceae bacterium]|nr:MAG: hypothetical protein KatS3mg111_3599 [Pirellulaceae bacterium]